MNGVSTFLWFDDNAEEAVNFYTSILSNSKIVSMNRVQGKVLTASFELQGRHFMALNGGPHYQFTPAVSLFVHCENQEEVDTLWNAFLEHGGKPMQCGWLTDRFGLSWQIIPDILGELLYESDPATSQRVMQAMMQMIKIDIDGLKRAAEQP